MLAFSRSASAGRPLPDVIVGGDTLYPDGMSVSADAGRPWAYCNGCGARLRARHHDVCPRRRR